MPYKTKWEPHSILTTWTGNVTGDELIAFAKEVHSNPNFDQLRYSLHDFTACTGATFAPEAVELASALDSAASMSNSRIKIGVTTERDDVKAMGAAYMGADMSQYPVRIFTTVKEMRDWEVKDWSER